MGKMKELFMKTNYPFGDYDLEREYLIDDMLAQERQYELEQENPIFLTSKIEVANGVQPARIEIGEEVENNDSENEGSEIRLQSSVHSGVLPVSGGHRISEII